MLTAADLELLTAAVDGVLTVRQQRRLARLLESSPEARSTYARLQQDAATLRNLPDRPCPVDLSGSVLSAIHRLPRKTAPRRVVAPAAGPSPADVPAWFAFALAASVLFLIGTASFLYFDASRTPDRPTDPQNNNSLAKNQQPPAPIPVPEAPTPAPSPAPMPEPEMPPVVVQQPPQPEPQMPPMGLQEPEPIGPIFTGPSGERIVLRTIEPTAPTLHKLSGLEQPRLLSDLSKAGAFRLELPCRDAGKVVDRLLPVLKTQDLSVTVDAIARGRLDRPQWKSSYLLVLDDVLPGELAALLEALAETDRKVDPRKPADSTPVLPSRFVLSRMNKLDQQDLRDHLGADLPVIPAPRTNGPLGIDPTRPLAEQTAEEIERKLSGGKTTRPALLLAYGMPRQISPSADARKFLDLRKPARPGSLQVLFVLRHVG